MKFVLTKQTLQNFEENLSEFILEHNLVDSYGVDYSYSYEDYSKYNRKINGWYFKLAPSEEYLKYMSRVLHNCVGAGRNYHFDIIEDNSYIVHGINGDQHMCININSNGVLQAKAKYNKNIKELGEGAYNSLKQYEKEVKNY